MVSQTCRRSALQSSFADPRSALPPKSVKTLNITKGIFKVRWSSAMRRPSTSSKHTREEVQGTADEIHAMACAIAYHARMAKYTYSRSYSNIEALALKSDVSSCPLSEHVKLREASSSCRCFHFSKPRVINAHCKRFEPIHRSSSRLSTQLLSHSSEPSTRPKWSEWQWKLPTILLRLSHLHRTRRGLLPIATRRCRSSERLLGMARVTAIEQEDIL